MPFIQAGDLRVHYRDHGAGEPVLFVHGNWATSAWWEPTLDRLPGSYRGIAYDLRGRGQTEGPDHGYTMPEMAADLLAFADLLGLTTFHLVGHSLGSAIAMQVALEQPTRVRSLTALAPAWVDGMPAAYNAPAAQEAIKADKELFARVLKPLAPAAPEDDLWRRVVDEGHQQRLEAALRNLPALLTWTPGDRLGAITIPALVISGALDTLTGGANADRAAAALGAPQIIMPNIGHSPNIEAPDEFVRLLVQHLSANH